MVRRIVLRGGKGLIEVAPDDPSLADGWWAAERDDAAVWRWTDGDAALPPIDDLAIVEVSVGGTLAYPLSQPMPGSGTASPVIIPLAA